MDPGAAGLTKAEAVMRGAEPPREHQLTGAGTAKKRSLGVYYECFLKWMVLFIHKQ